MAIDIGSVSHGDGGGGAQIGGFGEGGFLSAVVAGIRGGDRVAAIDGALASGAGQGYRVVKDSGPIDGDQRKEYEHGGNDRQLDDGCCTACFVKGSEHVANPLPRGPL